MIAIMRLPLAQVFAAALACLLESARGVTATCKPAAKPAAICGKTGTVSIAGLDQFLDARKCAAYCADLGNCGGFSHQPKNNLCTLYELVTGDELIENFYTKDPKGNTTLYVHPGCFTCNSTVCDVSPDFNLLNNADFTLSDTVIGPWKPILEDSIQSSQGLRIIPNPIGPGNAVQFSLITGTDSRFQTLEQYRQLCKKQMYRIQVDYKVDQLSDTPPGGSIVDTVIKVTLFSSSCTNAVSYAYDDPQLSKWHHLDCSFEFTGQSPLQFFFSPIIDGYDPRGMPQGLAWNVTAANFKMTQLPAGIIKTKGDSLVRNGGFESGKVAPWNALGEYLTENGYNSEPPLRCAKHKPIYSVISPGYSKLGGSASSKTKYKYRFCGVAGNTEGDYYDATESDILFSIEQKIFAELDKTYVLSIQYGITNGHLQRINAGNVDFAFPIHPLVGTTNETLLDQRIFQGSGDRSFLSLAYFSRAQGKGPLAQLQVILDNISIKEIDE